MGNELGGIRGPEIHLNPNNRIANPVVPPQPIFFGPRMPIFRPPPLRDFLRRRQFYSQEQKDRAVRLLNLGVPCRQVAILMGPRCSSGTPVRWQKEAVRNEKARYRMQQLLNNAKH